MKGVFFSKLKEIKLQFQTTKKEFLNMPHGSNNSQSYEMEIIRQRSEEK